MNLTRRSFLRSLGAALLAPLLPKVVRVDEKERVTDFLMSCECSESASWELKCPCSAWDDRLVDFNHGEEVEWAARLEEIMVDFRERMRNADWETPTYAVVMHPDNFDSWYANVPWFRRAVDGFDV